MKNKKILILLAVLVVCAALAALCVVRSELPFYLRQELPLALQKEELLPADPADYTWQAVDASLVTDQSALLVNADHPLPEGFAADIAAYGETDVQMNRCLQDAYRNLAASVREKYDQPLYVRSAYRSREEQLSEWEADPVLAALPGTSEHETGLALDVYVPYFAGAGFLNCPAGQYVNLHAQDFGFIIRYPRSKETVTGIPYEPWHLRYVGQPHARIVTANRLTWEEYIDLLSGGELFTSSGILIALQEAQALRVPEGFTATLSPVYEGYYLMTAVPEWM